MTIRDLVIDELEDGAIILEGEEFDEEYQEKADRLTSKMQLMTVELAHYRAEPQQTSLDGSVIEAARKSVVASRSLLQATLDVLDEITGEGNDRQNNSGRDVR